MTEGFMKALPGYLAIGMPPEEFWEGDPWLVSVYREAYRLRTQRRSEEMWLQGFYIYHAVSAAVANIFSKRGAPKAKYLEDPIRVTPLSEAEKEAEAEKERQKVIEYLSNWAKGKEDAVWQLS